MCKYLISLDNIAYNNLRGEIMVYFRIEELLKKKKKSKYWLCQNMNITSHNLNRVIRGETSSISFKYLEELCKFLDCSIEYLIVIEKDA